MRKMEGRGAGFGSLWLRVLAIAKPTHLISPTAHLATRSNVSAEGRGPRTMSSSDSDMGLNLRKSKHQILRGSVGDVPNIQASALKCTNSQNSMITWVSER